MTMNEITKARRPGKNMTTTCMQAFRMLHEGRAGPRAVLGSDKDQERDKTTQGGLELTSAEVLIPLTKLLGTSHRRGGGGGEEEDLLVVVATARPKERILALLRSNSQQDLHVYQIW